jgi:hypothetical protein
MLTASPTLHAASQVAMTVLRVSIKLLTVIPRLPQVLPAYARKAGHFPVW